MDRVLAIRKERYPDWSLKHLHERPVERHKLSISCTRIWVGESGQPQRSDREQVGLGLEQGPTCTQACFDLVAPHLTDLVSKIYDQEKCKCSYASKIADLEKWYAKAYGALPTVCAKSANPTKCTANDSATYDQTYAKTRLKADSDFLACLEQAEKILAQ
jgi:hypothetical protein